MADLETYRWLLSTSGRQAIALAQELMDSSDLLAATTALRKQLTPEQTSLALQQVELRARGISKFDHAKDMFFTEVGLQQASSQALANYKAQRFPAGGEVFDLCCGIGGDLFSLGHRALAVGVDRDPVSALFAEANCEALGLSQTRVVPADVTQLPFDSHHYIHIDPDRRPHGKRTTTIELHEPGREFLQMLIANSAGGAIKLAPATEIPHAWLPETDLEWISHNGECKQLVVWFGGLRRHSRARCATVIDSAGEAASFVGDAEERRATTCDAIGRYILEPDNAILAAGLVDEFATTHQLQRISSEIAYLTGDALSTSPLLSAFEVIDHTSFDLKKVKAMLKTNDVAVQEVKKRGVDVEPEQLRRKLRREGSTKGTIILTPFGGQVIAILTRRV